MEMLQRHGVGAKNSHESYELIVLEVGLANPVCGGPVMRAGRKEQGRVSAPPWYLNMPGGCSLAGGFENHH